MIFNWLLAIYKKKSSVCGKHYSWRVRRPVSRTWTSSYGILSRNVEVASGYLYKCLAAAQQKFRRNLFQKRRTSEKNSSNIRKNIEETTFDKTGFPELITGRMSCGALKRWVGSLEGASNIALVLTSSVAIIFC